MEEKECSKKFEKLLVKICKDFKIKNYEKVIKEFLKEKQF